MSALPRGVPSSGRGGRIPPPLIYPVWEEPPLPVALESDDFPPSLIKAIVKIASSYSKVSTSLAKGERCYFLEVLGVALNKTVDEVKKYYFCEAQTNLVKDAHLFGIEISASAFQASSPPVIGRRDDGAPARISLEEVVFIFIMRELSIENLRKKVNDFMFGKVTALFHPSIVDLIAQETYTSTDVTIAMLQKRVRSGLEKMTGGSVAGVATSLETPVITSEETLSGTKRKASELVDGEEQICSSQICEGQICIDCGMGSPDVSFHGTSSKRCRKCFYSSVKRMRSLRSVSLRKSSS